MRIKFLIAVILFQISNNLAAQTSISDSLDILHTDISLTVIDFDGKTIDGKADIELQALVEGVETLSFDLLALIVDSVKVSGINQPFEQVGEKLNIEYSIDSSDIVSISIYYHGEPDKDDLWGGWYWSGEKAFQLGVGFISEPHNYGRIWFPCFDNFQERSTFNFNITTLENHKAFCGGVLIDSLANGDGTVTWSWQLNQNIPSYLASVAVADYTTVEWEYEGVLEDIPVQLGVLEADSTDMINSFVHLNDAMAAFEQSYGPYQWDRVGYVAVPFGGGAMEHACNIAYPDFAIDGGTTWETLMAHELAHSWWGNLITCAGANEMWLNEGWASFSEYLFLEYVYGRDSYEEIVNSTHLDVIRYGYAYDGNVFEPLAGVSHENTYGFTTYTRGSVIVHNLRGYLGDDLFFSCISSFLDTYAFQDVSSEQFQDYLTDCSGMDMTGFFNGWIFNSGTPSIELQNSFEMAVADEVNLCLEQKLNKASEWFLNMPVEVSLVNKEGETRYKTTIMTNGQFSNHTISVPDTAINDYEFIVLDRNNLIADAVTADELFITETGSFELEQALMDLEVNGMLDAQDWIRVEHYWVAADGFKSPIEGVQLNNQRYWKVMGSYDSNNTSASFLFNGTLSISGGYLDDEFITNSDDSLLLFYRANPQDEWLEYAYYEMDPWGNKTDKRGIYELSRLNPGEYAMGIYNSELPSSGPDLNECELLNPVFEESSETWNVIPNPANHTLQINGLETGREYHIKMSDINGKLVYTGVLNSNGILDVQNLPEGQYILQVIDRTEGVPSSQKVMIIR